MHSQHCPTARGLDARHRISIARARCPSNTTMSTIMVEICQQLFNRLVPVRIVPTLFHAGLSRRCVTAIFRQLKTTSAPCSPSHGWKEPTSDAARFSVLTEEGTKRQEHRFRRANIACLKSSLVPIADGPLTSLKVCPEFK